MVGYSRYKIYALLLLAVLSFFSFSLGGGKRVHILQPLSVKADRSSPAFAAIEDAFALKDYILVKPLKISVPVKNLKSDKVQTKGLKVSLKPKAGTPVLKLKGEKIDVAHFTNKFIEQRSKIKIAKITPQWNLEKQVLPLAGAERKSPVKVTKIIEKASSPKNEVVLSSGIKLTKEEPKTVTSQSAVEEVSYAKPLGLGQEVVFKPNLIKGKLFVEGADFDAHGGNYAFHVERFYDGKVFEVGVYDAAHEKYEIEVGSQKGYLRVELRDGLGAVVAFGERKIQKENNIDISLYPSETILAGRVLDQEKSVYNNESPLSEANITVEGVEGTLAVDQEGYFNEDLFEKGSTFIAKASEKEMWSEVQVGLAGKPLFPRLKKKGALRSLSQNIDPFGEEIEITSLLHAQVSQKGLGQKGLRVSLYGMEFQRPVYYDRLGRPNPHLKATTENSKFSFVNLADGAYLVQVFRKDKLLGQKWFVVREGHIAKGQIELSHKSYLLAEVSPFPHKNKESQVAFYEVGNEKFEDHLLGHSQKEIHVISQPEFSVFEYKSQTEESKKHIYIGLSKAKEKVFKVVEDSWLKNFLNARRSNANHALGIVIGFVKEEAFEVLKGVTSAKSADSQIYYFDRHGDFVESGIAGGGFIITDVPPGLKNVVIKERGRKTYKNKMVFIEGYAVSIFD